MSSAAHLENEPANILPATEKTFRISRVERRFSSLNQDFLPVLQLSKLRYNRAGNVTSVRATQDGELQSNRRFHYSRSNDRIDSIECSEGPDSKKRIVKFTYDKRGRLQRATECVAKPPLPNWQGGTNPRVEYLYCDNAFQSAVHHWSVMEDGARIDYQNDGRINQIHYQFGAFQLRWSQNQIRQITSLEKTWDSDFYFEYSHNRLQKVHTPGVTYRLYYNNHDLISRIVLLDEIYDRHVVTQYTYKAGQMPQIRPFPDFEHGRLFNFEGKPLGFFPLLSLDSIFGL